MNTRSPVYETISYNISQAEYFLCEGLNGTSAWVRDMIRYYPEADVSQRRAMEEICAHVGTSDELNFVIKESALHEIFDAQHIQDQLQTPAEKQNFAKIRAQATQDCLSLITRDISKSTGNLQLNRIEDFANVARLRCQILQGTGHDEADILLPIAFPLGPTGSLGEKGDSALNEKVLLSLTHPAPKPNDILHIWASTQLARLALDAQNFSHAGSLILGVIPLIKNNEEKQKGFVEIINRFMTGSCKRIREIENSAAAIGIKKNPEGNFSLEG